MVESPSAKTALLMLTIVLAPLRYFMSWIMTCSAQKNDPREPPPLFNVAAKRFSPLTHVRQCFSAMMDGSYPGLRLLYGRPEYRCTSFSAWVGTHPSLASSLRRMITTADSWIFRKPCRLFESWPWKLCSVGDLRLPYEVRLAVANEFMTPCTYCLDPFFSRRIRSKFGSLQAEDLCRDRFWLAAILMWSRMVMLCIMMIENIHAQNKVQLINGCRLYTFISKVIIAESRRLKAARDWMKNVIVREG